MSEEQHERKEREKYAEIEGCLLKRHHESHLHDLDVEQEEMVYAFRDQMKGEIYEGLFNKLFVLNCTYNFLPWCLV